MKYRKANSVLPEELIIEIQKYIDGEFIYIPRKLGKEMSWGEKSGTKKYLRDRNSNILLKYLQGSKVEELSEEYYLSEQSIRRIIYQEKRMLKIDA